MRVPVVGEVEVAWDFVYFEATDHSAPSFVTEMLPCPCYFIFETDVFVMVLLSSRYHDFFHLLFDVGDMHPEIVLQIQGENGARDERELDVDVDPVSPKMYLILSSTCFSSIIRSVILFGVVYEEMALNERITRQLIEKIEMKAPATVPSLYSAGTFL